MRLQNHYFLAGINDEGQYFCHEVTNSSLFLNGAKETVIEEAVAWMNRADQGYSVRAQGDVLLQYIPLSMILVRTPTNPSHIIRVTAEYPTSGIESISFALNGRSISHGMYKQVEPHIKLGNHFATTEICFFVARYSYSDDPVAVAIGEELTLQHVEHSARTIQIPKNHAALIAPQRGRTITISGEQEVRVQGFD